MTKTLLFTIKKSFLLLVKKPYYIIFGILFTFGNWTPISISSETKNSPDFIPLQSTFITSQVESFSLETIAIIFLFLLFVLWVIKIIALSLVYLGVFSSCEKKPKYSFLKNIKTALISLPSVISLHLLLFLSLSLLFLFLALPVVSLINAHSFFSAWFLGMLATCIFFLLLTAIFSLFLFTYCFLLFNRLSLKISLDASALLYQKKIRESTIFVFFFFLLFLAIKLFILMLPGFILSDTGLSTINTHLPYWVNLLGFILSYLLLSFYFTLFAMATIIFFLKIAKQPPVKNILFQEERSPVTTLLKKKSETFQETKNTTF